MPVQAKTYAKVMPGRDGVRVPLDRFVDVHGRWGYAIPQSRVDRAGLHILYNYVLFQDTMAGRDKGGVGLADMGVLMERNWQDNKDWCIRNGDSQGFRCWSKLFGRYEGETLVIASCGPSLTESLPMLYKHRKRFRLLCLNRSLRPFMDPEVKPDFFYFVERRGIPDWVHDVKADGSVGKPFDLNGITLIATPQCDPRIVRRFDHDRVHWGYTELGAFGHVPEITTLEKFDLKAATTIGNAPYIAWKLGFKRIICVGCDFALDCDYQVNPKDAKDCAIVPTRMYFDKYFKQTHYATDAGWENKMLPLVGINDRACMSDPNLVGHVAYFSAVLDFLHFDGGVECINATPRGLLRFNCMGLEEALDADRSL